MEVLRQKVGSKNIHSNTQLLLALSAGETEQTSACSFNKYYSRYQC